MRGTDCVRPFHQWSATALAACWLVACGSTSSQSAAVGGSGGSPPTEGGSSAETGGSESISGSPALTGGVSATTGGATNAGGSSNKGGAPPVTGGALGKGGAPASGGAISKGGASSVTGGRSNTGGAAAAGTSSAGGPADPAAPCATYGNRTITGNLFEGATGISGIVASRRQPGVFWIHSDRQKILYAIDQTGALLGQWEVTSSAARFFYIYNWEDISIQAMDGGPDRIWIGDIGNNYVRGGGDPRTSIKIMSIDEPTVDSSQVVSGTVPVQGNFDYTYPEGILHDAEGMAIDPLTGDLYIFSKEETSPSLIFRAKAPLAGGELEQIGTVDTTNINGADFSASGRELLVRNYGTAYYWTRSGDRSWEEVLTTPPSKQFRLQFTDSYYSEAIGYAADESGFYVVSEEDEGAPPSPVEFYQKTCK